MKFNKWASADYLRLLFSIGLATYPAGQLLATLPAVPPPPVILPSPLSASPSQAPRPVQEVQLMLIQDGQVIVDQHLRIGGRGSSGFTISEPVESDAAQCPENTRWRSNGRQISVTISPQYDAKTNLYSLNIRYSRPEKESDCPYASDRIVTLQQTFDWRGKLMEFKVSDDLRMRLAP